MKSTMKPTLLILAAAVAPLAPITSMADITPAAMFTDNMVIQRDTQAPVWGTADAGEKVNVTASWGATTSTTAPRRSAYSCPAL